MQFPRLGSEMETNQNLLEETQPEKFPVEKGYKGYHLSLPLNRKKVAEMMESFKVNKVSKLS